MTFTAKKMAEFLGVEMGEQFQLCDDGGTYASIYRITKYGFEYLREENKWERYQFDVNDLIGKFVKRLLWKPRKGDYYCFFDFEDRERIVNTTWNESIADLALYAIGNCFYSNAEAEAHRDEVIASLKSIYKNGREGE